MYSPLIFSGYSKSREDDGKTTYISCQLAPLASNQMAQWFKAALPSPAGRQPSQRKRFNRWCMKSAFTPNKREKQMKQTPALAWSTCTISPCLNSWKRIQISMDELMGVWRYWPCNACTYEKAKSKWQHKLHFKTGPEHHIPAEDWPHTSQLSPK